MNYFLKQESKFENLTSHNSFSIVNIPNNFDECHLIRRIHEQLSEFIILMMSLLYSYDELHNHDLNA